MTTYVHAALCTLKVRGQTGVSLLDSAPRLVETLTASASSGQGTNVAIAGDVWSVTANGGNVFVAFGTNPTAVSGAGFLVMANQTREFGAAAGEKIAVITAP